MPEEGGGNTLNTIDKAVTLQRREAILSLLFPCTLRFPVLVGVGVKYFQCVWFAVVLFSTLSFSPLSAIDIFLFLLRSLKRARDWSVISLVEIVGDILKLAAVSWKERWCPVIALCWFHCTLQHLDSFSSFYSQLSENLLVFWLSAVLYMMSWIDEWDFVDQFGAALLCCSCSCAASVQI